MRLCSCHSTLDHCSSSTLAFVSIPWEYWCPRRLLLHQHLSVSSICPMLHIHRWDLLWLETFCRQHLCWYCVPRCQTDRYQQGRAKIWCQKEAYTGAPGLLCMDERREQTKYWTIQLEGLCYHLCFRRVFDVGFFHYSHDLWHHDL